MNPYSVLCSKLRHQRSIYAGDIIMSVGTREKLESALRFLNGEYEDAEKRRVAAFIVEWANDHCYRDKTVVVTSKEYFKITFDDCLQSLFACVVRDPRLIRRITEKLGMKGWLEIPECFWPESLMDKAHLAEMKDLGVL